MREAIGGSILFFIILGFIAVFIVFIALIMNYASAYRTNNYVVNMIEQYEGSIKFGSSSDSINDDTLIAYLKRNNYYKPLTVTCNNVGDSSNPRGAVFSVTTYVHFELPLLGVFRLELPIKNDTKTVYGIRCKDSSIQSTGEWNPK